MKIPRKILLVGFGCFAVIASFLLIEVKAQVNKGYCRFNGRTEDCVVNWIWNGSSERVALVTWLSDCKQTSYRTGGDGFCLILEDNERKTNCSWSYLGKSIRYVSSRGNITILPSW